MAIITEAVTEKLVRHYSDAGMMIRQTETGVLYSEAVDVVPCQYTYEETDTPVPEGGGITDTEALHIITGGRTA